MFLCQYLRKNRYFSFPLLYVRENAGKYEGKSSLIHLGKLPPVENYGFQPVHVRASSSFLKHTRWNQNQTLTFQ